MDRKGVSHFVAHGFDQAIQGTSVGAWWRALQSGFNGIKAVTNGDFCKTCYSTMTMYIIELDILTAPYTCCSASQSNALLTDVHPLPTLHNPMHEGEYDKDILGSEEEEERDINDSELELDTEDEIAHVHELGTKSQKTLKRKRGK